MRSVERAFDPQCLACVGCGTRAAAAARLPRGWKRIPDPLCATCVSTRYLCRAVTVPIAEPLDATWAELASALREAWSDTTRCANWIVTELYTRDVRREPDDTKLRPMPRSYLYPQARERFPGISPINLTALIQQVERTYREQRYELLWTGTRSLAVHRYPVPAPIHAQAWELEPESDGGVLVARIRLGDRWWRLRLQRGPRVHAQGRQVRELLSGAALRAAGALYSVRGHGGRDAGDARSGVADRREYRRVLLKLVGWFPRPTARGAGALEVSTAASDLLIARQHGHGIVLTVHADHIRRAIASYTVRQTRLSEDLGVARRFKASERSALERRRSVLAERQRVALRTWCGQLASQVVRCATDRGLREVRYEDEVQDFCDPFPWQALRLRLQHTVEREGLTWTYASGDPTATDEGSARIAVSEEVST